MGRTMQAIIFLMILACGGCRMSGTVLVETHEGQTVYIYIIMDAEQAAGKVVDLPISIKPSLPGGEE